MISAEVIADSVSTEGKRLTTFKLVYPKFIHGEFMTHRVISRNASSSRAIPVAKLIAEVLDEATRAGPVYWGAEQKGMQSGAELEGDDLLKAHAYWAIGARRAAQTADAMNRLGVHKSIVNRVLEPYSHIRVVATATEWDNFNGLRLDRAAQPEIRALAIAMFEARKASTPKLLKSGQWHLPFVNEGEFEQDYSDNPISYDVKVSVARCARVSYESFETGKRSTVEEDLKLYERLVGSQPLHASPAEHQATPDKLVEMDIMTNPLTEEDKANRLIKLTMSGWWEHPTEHGNFIGWRQYRKMLPGEAVAPLPEEFR